MPAHRFAQARPGHPRPVRGQFIGVLTLGLLLAMLLPASAGPASAADTSGDDYEPRVLDAVILVDESGSLTDADLTQEKQAVALIAQGMLSPHSRVTVVGFGSSNRDKQSAVDVACPPTVLDSDAAKNGITSCAAKLKIRSDNEGNDTDHALALTQALSYFQSGGPDAAHRVVFLLTDGKLDVHNSPQWGQVADTRDQAALETARRTLAQLRSASAQVWPLGFGSEIDKARLDEFAAGGAQALGGCQNQPAAQVVTDRSVVAQTLFKVYGAAACGITDGPRVFPVPGSTTVHVPVFATDGAIVVAKSDARLKVHYLAPDGNEAPLDGVQDGSRYSHSGQGLLVESLRIVNPKVGIWEVKVDQVGGLSNQYLTVMALWQGTVRAAVYSEPPVATPGQNVVVRVALTTRAGEFKSPEALNGVAVSLTSTDTNDPNAQPTATTVRDDGTGSDPRPGDGVFSGALAVPDQPTDLQLTATVTGPGIISRPLPMVLRVVEAPELVSADFTVSVPDHVTVGDRATGTLTATNNTERPVQARLVVDRGNGRVGLASPDNLSLAKGPSTSKVVVRFPADAQPGAVDARLLLVDSANPSFVYGAVPLTTVLKAQPTFVLRYWKVLAALAALLVAAGIGALWRSRKRTRQADISGLMVDLIGADGRPVGPSLLAPSRPSRVLRFHAIGLDSDPSAGRPRLSNTDSAGRGMAFELHRIGSGLVRVEGAHGIAVDLHMAGTAEPIVDQWSLRVREKSTSRPSSAEIPDDSSPGWEDDWAATGVPPGPGAQAGPTSPPGGSSSQAQDDDPWM